MHFLCHQNANHWFKIKASTSLTVTSCLSWTKRIGKSSLFWIFWSGTLAPSFTRVCEAFLNWRRHFHTKPQKTEKVGLLTTNAFVVSAHEHHRKICCCVTRQTRKPRPPCTRPQMPLKRLGHDRQSQNALPKGALRRPNKPASALLSQHYSSSLTTYLLDEKNRSAKTRPALRRGSYAAFVLPKYAKRNITRVACYPWLLKTLMAMEGGMFGVV